MLIHDAAYSDSKDLATRTISDKIAKGRGYKIARDCKYYGYQRALAGMVHRFFVKKAGFELTVNEQIAAELHKPVINKFKRKKVYARFKDNIWMADLAEMRSLLSTNKNFKCLLWFLDVFL